MSIRLFMSYAHKDVRLRQQLAKHLKPLEREGLITSWHDREINPGKDFGKEIEAHLRDADLVLLLVSPDFVSSEYCWGVEMQVAMSRHVANKCRVIPIILRPVDWHHSPFGKLLALPEDGKPVTLAARRDAAFLEIAKGIRRTILDMLSASSPDLPHESNFSQTGSALNGTQVTEGHAQANSPSPPRGAHQNRDVEITADSNNGKPATGEQSEVNRETSEDGQPIKPDPESLTLIGIVRTAVQAVPAVRFALGVAGVIAALALVKGFFSSTTAALLGGGAMFILMVLLVVFAAAVKLGPASFRHPALFFTWSILTLFVGCAFLVATTVFFSWPKGFSELYNSVFASRDNNPAPPPPVLQPTVVFRVTSFHSDMIAIEPGDFLMGTPASEPNHEASETQHRVRMTHRFAMAIYETTQAQYQSLMKTDPIKGHRSVLNNPCEMGGVGDDNPTLCVSWYDAIRFCNALSASEHLQSAYELSGNNGQGVKLILNANGYRLPTEAEWEYAARAHGSATYVNGDALQDLQRSAWFAENSGRTSHIVGTRAPNAWGLYDLNGNVWEWVWDWYAPLPSTVQTDPTGPPSGELKVWRGGSWYTEAPRTRVGFRWRMAPETKAADLGFRIVRNL